VSVIRGETSKAFARRAASGWFRQFIADPGIDIGAGDDPLNHTFRRWDKHDGDATAMASVPDETFRTVYASHLLEHLDDPDAALRNWWRILQPGGCLIVVVPHRDLYERKVALPSRWNSEHKTFWLPDRDEPPVTRSLAGTVGRVLGNPRIEYVEVVDEGWQAVPLQEHPVGEYSIEVVVRKQAPRASAGPTGDLREGGV